MITDTLSASAPHGAEGPHRDAQESDQEVEAGSIEDAQSKCSDPPG